MNTLTNDPVLGMYVSAAVAVAVVIGLFIYLWSMDRRVNELRRAMSDRPRALTGSAEPLRPQRRVQPQEEQDNGKA